MSSDFKNFLKLILKTLFSNDACIEASCVKKIVTNIVAIFFALISIFSIPLPTIINIYKNKGSNWIDNKQYFYDFDEGIINFIEKCKKDSINISFTNNDLLIKKGENVLEKYESYEYHWEVIQNINDVNKSKKTYLSVYFTEKINKDYQSFCEEKKKEKTTIMIFGKKEINCYFFNHKSKIYESSLLGNYEKIKINNLHDNLFEKNNGRYDKKKTMNKWKDFFDSLYEGKKIKIIMNEIMYESLTMILIMFFTGLIVWFLTHTKNNLYRIHSFWTSQKIVFYTSLTPSILALLFGFIIKSTLLFIILMIVRIHLLNKIFKQN